MRITYFSTDEVNRFLVGRWAPRAGGRVCFPKENQSMDRGHWNSPVILDLDGLSPVVRANWLRQLSAGAIPALVHGHNISDADAAGLRRLEIRVCQGRVRRTVLCEWIGELLGDTSSSPDRLTAT
jgi:hypothetical protein